MSDKTKYKAIVLLNEGKEPKEVANILDVSYAKVLRWRRELEASIAEGSLNKLLNMDEAAVEIMAQEMVAELPPEMQPLAEEELKNVTDGVKGLNKLASEFQKTASILNQRIRTQCISIEHVSELTELTKALCELQNAFFNKQQTQVNVQNNYGNDSASEYSEFMGDAPGA